MPYYKRNEKCKNASGESGAFVTIKKSGGERKCWKNKQAFEKSSAARHAKGIKKEMNITKEQLQKIILEEVEVVNREDNLSRLYLEAFAEHGISEAMLEGRSWFPTVAAGIAIGAVGALGLAVDSEMDAKASQRAERAEQIAADLGKLDTKTKEMNQQLKNFNAWQWSESDNPENTQQYPMIEFEELPGSKFTVMPPEYSIFLQVLEDKEAGIMRYGIPGDMGQIEDLMKDIKNFSSNVNTDGSAGRDFTEDFNIIGYYDTLEDEVGTYAIGGQIYKSGNQMKQAQAILPDFEALEQVYDGQLPLSGLSVQDTYNSFMFGPYLSTEEIEKITGEQNYNPDPSFGSQEIEEIIKEEINRYLNA
jgi:hypothetical protein